MVRDSATSARTLVDEHVAAKFLGRSVSTLRKNRVYGTGPAFIKMGRSVRYDLADLQKFIDGSRRTSTSEVGNAR